MQPQNINDLTSLVSIAEMAGGVLAVASLLVAVYVLHFAARQILNFLSSDGEDNRMSRADYNWSRVMEGKYIPREDFEQVARDNPNYSGSKEFRTYAKNMSKQGMW